MLSAAAFILFARSILPFFCAGVKIDDEMKRINKSVLINQKFYEFTGNNISFYYQLFA
jgi:hypothetical protein